MMMTTHRLRNDLYCVEWDVKLYYTIPYDDHSRNAPAAAQCEFTAIEYYIYYIMLTGNFRISSPVATALLHDT